MCPLHVEVEPKKTTVRLPKDLELPQMKDFQMFDRDRLVELQNELQDKFKELRVRACGNIWRLRRVFAHGTGEV